MKYLLDTHAAVWLLEGSEQLSDVVANALKAETKDAVALADISLLEIAMLGTRGKIELVPSLSSALREIAGCFTVLPINAAIAADAVEVALPQKDPFDRLIAATARHHKLTLVTMDSQIAHSDVVKTLW